MNQKKSTATALGVAPHSSATSMPELKRRSLEHLPNKEQRRRQPWRDRSPTSRLKNQLSISDISSESDSDDDAPDNITVIEQGRRRRSRSRSTDRSSRIEAQSEIAQSLARKSARFSTSRPTLEDEPLIDGDVNLEKKFYLVDRKVRNPVSPKYSLVKVIETDEDEPTDEYETEVTTDGERQIHNTPTVTPTDVRKLLSELPRESDTRSTNSRTSQDRASERSFPKSFSELNPAISQSTLVAPALSPETGYDNSISSAMSLIPKTVSKTELGSLGYFPADPGYFSQILPRLRSGLPRPGGSIGQPVISTGNFYPQSSGYETSPMTEVEDLSGISDDDTISHRRQIMERRSSGDSAGGLQIIRENLPVNIGDSDPGTPQTTRKSARTGIASTDAPKMTSWHDSVDKVTSKRVRDEDGSKKAKRVDSKHVKTKTSPEVLKSNKTGSESKHDRPSTGTQKSHYTEDLGNETKSGKSSSVQSSPKSKPKHGSKGDTPPSRHKYSDVKIKDEVPLSSSHRNSQNSKNKPPTHPKTEPKPKSSTKSHHAHSKSDPVDLESQDHHPKQHRRHRQTSNHGKLSHDGIFHSLPSRTRTPAPIPVYTAWPGGDSDTSEESRSLLPPIPAHIPDIAQDFASGGRLASSKSFIEPPPKPYLASTLPSVIDMTATLRGGQRQVGETVADSQSERSKFAGFGDESAEEPARLSARKRPPKFHIRSSKESPHDASGSPTSSPERPSYIIKQRLSISPESAAMFNHVARGFTMPSKDDQTQSDVWVARDPLGQLHTRAQPLPFASPSGAVVTFANNSPSARAQRKTGGLGRLFGQRKNSETPLLGADTEEVDRRLKGNKKETML